MDTQVVSTIVHILHIWPTSCQNIANHDVLLVTQANAFLDGEGCTWNGATCITSQYTPRGSGIPGLVTHATYQCNPCIRKKDVSTSSKTNFGPWDNWLQ